MPPSPASRRYLQLDVFADRPGAGNPLGVVLDGRGFDAPSMQAFAAWTNLSETIFLLPPTTADADYRVRIFTPRQELPFAGHPSVGAAWAVLHAGLAQADEGGLVQECAAGLLPVRIDGDGDARRIHVRAPRAHPVDGATAMHAALLEAAMAGLARGRQAPALWNNGPAWWVVELADGDVVRGLQPDLAAIAALTRASDAVGLAVYGRSNEPGHQLVVRAFCPADNIPEDPVTGSVNACIAAQLATAGALPGSGGRYVARQGRELGRDGIVHVHIDADGEAWIGGQVQCVVDGNLAWAAASTVRA
jgi:PhzF family phenazine biosynthesis protein